MYKDLKIAIKKPRITGIVGQRVDKDIKDLSGNVVGKEMSKKSYYGTLFICNGEYAQKVSFVAEDIDIDSDNTV